VGVFAAPTAVLAGAPAPAPATDDGPRAVEVDKVSLLMSKGLQPKFVVCIVPGCTCTQANVMKMVQHLSRCALSPRAPPPRLLSVARARPRLTRTRVRVRVAPSTRSDHTPDPYSADREAVKEQLAAQKRAFSSLPGAADLIFCPQPGCCYSGTPSGGGKLRALKGLLSTFNHVVEQHIAKDQAHLLKVMCTMPGCTKVFFNDEAHARRAHEGGGAQEGARRVQLHVRRHALQAALAAGGARGPHRPRAAGAWRRVSALRSCVSV
jgi:hypothetical protein